MLLLCSKREVENQRYSQLHSSKYSSVSLDVVLVTVSAQNNHPACAAKHILLQKYSVMRLLGKLMQS